MARAWVGLIAVLAMAAWAPGGEPPSIAGKPAPALFTRPLYAKRNVNLRNIQGNTTFVVFLCTTKMVPLAKVGPESCSG